MGIGQVLKLAGKFAIRGFIFKAGKKAAVRSGRIGIGAFSLLTGGYMAYSLLQMREDRMQEHDTIESSSNSESAGMIEE